MAPVIALLVTLAAPSTAAFDAAVRQYHGDAAGALKAAESILASTPDDLAAGLVATCAAIEAGDLRRAGALLTSIERRRLAPRAAVLRRLIERRSRSSKGSLMEDLALAWRDAGRPDLDGADPDIARASQAPLPAPPLPSASLTPGERLVLAPPDAAEDQRRLAFAAAAEANRNALVVNLEVLGLLGMLPCPSDPTEQRAAVAPALEAAIRIAPENGYVAVAGWIAGCPERLETTGVTLLSNAARSELEYPRERAFREILAMTERVDPPNARLRAVSAWLALDVPFMRLVALAEAIEDPALRRAAGRAIEAVGWRMVEGDAWLERLQGVSLAQKGARLSEDEDAIARARVEREHRLYQEWTEARRMVGQWPFAAEWREWAPDEVGASRRLLGLLSQYVQ